MPPTAPPAPPANSTETPPTTSDAGGAGGTAGTTAPPANSTETPPPPPPPAEAKPGETFATPPATAPAYALKTPEGFKPDAAYEKFLATAQKHGMKPETAQEVFDLYNSSQQSLQQAQQDEATATRKGWIAANRADKDIGGQAYDTSRQHAQKALQRFGDAELTTLLSNGIGDHPALARLFVKIGKALGEDALGGTAERGGLAPQSDEAKLRARFPTMYAAKE